MRFFPLSVLHFNPFQLQVAMATKKILVEKKKVLCKPELVTSKLIPADECSKDCEKDVLAIKFCLFYASVCMTQCMLVEQYCRVRVLKQLPQRVNFDPSNFKMWQKVKINSTGEGLKICYELVKFTCHIGNVLAAVV